MTFFLCIVYRSAVCIKRSYCQEVSGIDDSGGTTSSLMREAGTAEEGMSTSV